MTPSSGSTTGVKFDVARSDDEPDVLGEARSVLARNDLGALRKLLVVHVGNEQLINWIQGQIRGTRTGAQLLRVLIEPPEESDASVQNQGASADSEHSQPNIFEELIAESERDTMALVDSIFSTAPAPARDLLERARRRSRGNPDASELCDMASNCAAAAIDVALANDDALAAQALARVFDESPVSNVVDTLVAECARSRAMFSDGLDTRGREGLLENARRLSDGHPNAMALCDVAYELVEVATNVARTKDTVAAAIVLESAHATIGQIRARLQGL